MISEQLFVESLAEVSGLALAGGFAGGEQGESQEGASVARGRQREMHLIVESAWPQR